MVCVILAGFPSSHDLLADDNIGAGVFSHSACARDRIQQRDGSRSLKNQRILDRPNHVDRPALVLDDGYRYDGVDQNLTLGQGLGNRGFHLGRNHAPHRDRVFEHRQAYISVGIHPHGARQLRRIVDGEGQQIVGPDRLGGQIGVGVIEIRDRRDGPVRLLGINAASQQQPAPTCAHGESTLLFGAKPRTIDWIGLMCVMTNAQGSLFRSLAGRWQAAGTGWRIYTPHGSACHPSVRPPGRRSITLQSLVS